MKKIIFFLISFLDYMVPKKSKKIVYTSFPDLTDNSFAMFVYISNNHPEYENIWLVENVKKSHLFKKMIHNYTKNTNYKFIKKNSLFGIYHYITAKYVFFTHGLYTGVKIPSYHIVVNLWHGMPLKTIAYLDKNFKGIVPEAKYTIATSTVFQELMAKAFKVDKKSVLVTGQPRNDLLFNVDKKKILANFGLERDYNNIFMWMPTYRKSIIGDIRVDGQESDSLPVISIDELDELNKVLNEINAYMLIKLHPMDVLTLKKFKKYSNIAIIKNNDFELKGIQLYTLLGCVDVLLTDYSSVYIDFILTEKPIAFVMEDMEAFSNTRGFVFDRPLDYMPGRIINNKFDFFDYISDLKKKLHYNADKNKLNSIYANFSENIINYLNISMNLK